MKFASSTLTLAVLLLSVSSASAQSEIGAKTPPPVPSQGEDSTEVPEPREDLSQGPTEGTVAQEDGGEEPPPITKYPVLTVFQPADYPPEAFEKGIETEVVLAIDIGADGQVEGVVVAVPSPITDFGFDDAALKAAMLFEFEPAEAGGEPIPVQITYKYRFVIEKKEVVPPPPEPGQVAEPVLRVEGLLLEQGTRDPLPGVLVTVFQGTGADVVGFEATTDKIGAFQFFDLPSGRWNIYAEPDGYYPLRTAEDLADNEKIDVRYFLERGSYNPFDMRVVAKRPKKEVSRTTIQIEEVEKIPGGLGDVLAVVQNLPSVARAQAGSGLIVVRGSAPEDTQIFVNGISVPVIYHFGGLRSVIPTGMLQNLDFYPGNFSSEYGRATGGIIDAGLKRLDPPKLGGYIDTSLLDTGIYIEAPIGEKGAVAIAGRRSYIDVLLNAVVPEDAPVNIIAAPRYYDYQLLANYRPVPEHELRAFVFGSNDTLKLLFENPASFDTQLTGGDFETSTSFYRGLLEWDFIPDENVKNNLRISAGRDQLAFSLGTQFQFDLDLVLLQARDTFELALADHLRLRLGFDYLYAISEGVVQLPRDFPDEGDPGGPQGPGDFTLAREEFDDTFHAPAAFVELEFDYEGLLVIPGIRFDYTQRTGDYSLQPRLALRYGATEEVTLKGGVGVFSQPPTFAETSQEFGNPDLGLERAIHYSAGVEYKPLEYLTVDLTGFYKDLRDLVGQPATDAFDESQVSYDNEGSGRAYGLEVLIRHEFANNFFGWLSYTLSKSERLDSGSEEYRNFDFDQTHIFTILGTYRLPRNWEIGGRWRYVTGNPTTPVRGSVYDSVLDRYEPVYGGTNTARVGTFHQLDLRIDKRWIYDGWILNAYLDVQNAYNRANPEGVEYNYDYTESRPQQGLPILTILGLRAEF